MSVVFRRKGIILTVVLAALVTVVYLNATTAPSFFSTARLLVSRGEPESVFNTRKMLLSWEEELNSEIEVLRSTTLGKMAQALLDESHAVDGFGQPIRFRPGLVRPTTTGKSAVLVVTYTADDPREAREALRALTRAYIDWRSETRSPPYVEAFFQTELEALRDRLADWEQRRAEFMSDEGIISIHSEQESLLRQREDAAFQLTGIRSRLAEYVARLEAVRDLQEEKRLDGSVEIFGLGDSEFNDETLLANIRKELNMRQAEYFKVRGQYTDVHPEVQAAKELVDRLELELDNEVENYARFLEARIAVAQARVSSLETTVRGIDEQLNGFPDKAARLAQYDRIIDALQTDYTTFVERHVDAKVETSGRPEWKVILLQPATPALRQRTRDYIRLALIPLFALLIGLALAFIFDGLDHSVKDATEVEEHLRVPVLGSLSRIR
jgi:uncharacterized protein involved in exopolysaccharide biosynthesis